MCTPSSKIKLCTCSSASVKDLKHFWELYRKRGESFMMLGEIVLTQGESPMVESVNKRILLQRINEPDCFDFDPDLKDGDHLQITFSCGDEEVDRIHYCFVYENGEWAEANSEYFKWLNRNRPFVFGKIENALETELPID